MAQLSMEEREVISQMFAAGHSRKAIAARPFAIGPPKGSGLID